MCISTNYLIETAQLIIKKTHIIMKIKMLFLGLCLNLFPVFAQRVLWEKTYPVTDFCDLKVIADGGFFLGGSSMQNTTVTKGDSTFKYLEGDFLLQKLTSDGNIQWAKKYGGLNWEVMNALERTPDGGCIMGGVRPMYSGSSLSTNKSIDDCWIVKVDKNGDVEWEKTFGGSQQDVLTSLCVTSDGGYAFAAITRSIDGNVCSKLKSGNAIWVVKLDAKGRIQWKSTYAELGYVSDNPIIICENKEYILSSSSFLATEESEEKNILSNYNRVANIYKLNNKGDMLWVKTYDNCKNGRIQDVKFTMDGGCVFVGATNKTDGDVKSGAKKGWIGLLVKLDAKGAISWKKTYGSSGDNQLSKVIITKTGYMLGGRTSSADGDVHAATNNVIKFWLVQTDKNGNLLQEQSFATDNNNFLGSIQPTLEGGYVLGGSESYAEKWVYKSRIKIIKIAGEK